MRLHAPIGIWLLFFPAAWGALLADITVPWIMLATLLLGAMLTRSAGCIINDLADRNLDRGVARTNQRPLASGAIGILDALVLLVLLLLSALYLALLLPPTVLAIALIAVPMMAAYPFMKRITWWPQAWLGLTFNLGVLIGWVATESPLTLASGTLYAAAIAWTLGYDTIYAMQDRADDARMGIRSTARRLGTRVSSFVAVCYAAMLCLLGLSGFLSGTGILYSIGLAGAALHAAWQIRALRRESLSYHQLFVSNQWLGLIITAALIADRLYAS